MSRWLWWASHKWRYVGGQLANIADVVVVVDGDMGGEVSIEGGESIGRWWWPRLSSGSAKAFRLRMRSVTDEG